MCGATMRLRFLTTFLVLFAAAIVLAVWGLRNPFAFAMQFPSIRFSAVHGGCVGLILLGAVAFRHAAKISGQWIGED